MALFTFGEGYHNFHHEFQYDYRNGVKPWQFDPTKWSIWLLHKLGLVRNLRTVPEEKILKAQIAEQQRRIAAALESHPAPLSESLQAMLHSAQQQMHDALAQWEQRLTEYRAAKERRHEISRRQRRQLKRELAQASSELREALGEWMSAHRIVFGGTAAA
jgi:stearoyl-CoA desaturase (delta-9 desaturase)